MFVCFVWDDMDFVALLVCVSVLIRLPGCGGSDSAMHDLCLHMLWAHMCVLACQLVPLCLLLFMSMCKAIFNLAGRCASNMQEMLVQKVRCIGS